jgi:toxin ParE1/3/4
MARLMFDRDAKQDLRQIVHYIGIEQKRPDTARRIARKIYATCKTYSRNPLMGELRNDIITGIRLFPVRPYVVFYFPLRDGILVARIIHGARDYPALFSTQ